MFLQETFLFALYIDPPTSSILRVVIDRTKWPSRVGMPRTQQLLAHTSICCPHEKEISDGLDRQDASHSLSVDGEAVPGGEQAPTQGSPPCRSAPDLSAVREGDLSDRLRQQDDPGTGVPSVQGPG